MKSETMILGVRIDDIGKKEICARFSDMLNSNRLHTVFTPNPEIIDKASEDEELKRILNSSDLSLADGIGVVWASKLGRNHIRDRIPGVDAGEALLCLSNKKGEGVFFLGAAPSVAESAAVEMKRKFRNLNVVGTNHGYFTQDENDEIVKKINDSGASILFVCLGAPKQEKWIYRNKEKLKNVRIAIALGGSLDVYAKNVNRAPKLLRNAGFEWLWRIVFLKGHAKRAGSLVRFCCTVIKESSGMWFDGADKRRK